MFKILLLALCLIHIGDAQAQTDAEKEREKQEILRKYMGLGNNPYMGDNVRNNEILESTQGDERVTVNKFTRLGSYGARNTTRSGGNSFFYNQNNNRNTSQRAKPLSLSDLTSRSSNNSSRSGYISYSNEYANDDTGYSLGLTPDDIKENRKLLRERNIAKREQRERQAAQTRNNQAAAQRVFRPTSSSSSQRPANLSVQGRPYVSPAVRR